MFLDIQTNDLIAIERLVQDQLERNGETVRVTVEKSGETYRCFCLEAQEEPPLTTS